MEPRRGALQENGQAAESVVEARPLQRCSTASSAGGDPLEVEEEVSESRAVLHEHCSVRDQQRVAELEVEGSGGSTTHWTLLNWKVLLLVGKLGNGVLVR